MSTLWIVLIILLTALSCGHIGYMIGVVRAMHIYADELSAMLSEQGDAGK